MKYAYKVGYGSHEDSEYAELISEECFTSDQLRYLVHQAVIEVLEDIKAGKDDDIFLTDNGPSYAELHWHVIQKLVVNHNFELLEYNSEWACFGWPSVTDARDWGSQRDEDLNELTSAIPDDLKDEINRIAELKKRAREARWRKEDADR